MLAEGAVHFRPLQPGTDPRQRPHRRGGDPPPPRRCNCSTELDPWHRTPLLRRTRSAGKDVVRARSLPAGVPAAPVDLARSRVKPIAVIANELSISESYLRNWLAQDDAD